MARPDYVNNGGEPSVATWQEACVISQEWADGARRAAARRKAFRHWLSLMLMLTVLIVLVALVLIISGTWNP